MRKYFLVIFFAGFLVFFAGNNAYAAKLSLSPSTGTFEVDGTFSISVFLNTDGQPVNVVDVVLRFPPNLLQLVSPTTGRSIVSVWTAQPSYDNKTGELRLQGGIPGGIDTNNGLISTLTFRAKSVGTATVRFSDESRVLAHDGKGSDVLFDTQNGVYHIVLPPPLGPIVSSSTHPDQEKWYSNGTAVLVWANVSEVEEYSYVLSSVPAEPPDDISEGMKGTVNYTDLPNGIHYFHIKAFRDGRWGGTTHFAIKVDKEPPAVFEVGLDPKPPTISNSIVAKWQTTDEFSGLDYYEYALVNLQPNTAEAAQQAMFVEAEPPQILKVDIGRYDFIVRAYDKSGNMREIVKRIEILTPFQAAARNVWLWILTGVITVVLAFAAYKTMQWRRHLEERHGKKELPVEIKKQLKQLQEYRRKYGNMRSSGPMAAIFFAFAISFAALFGGSGSAFAMFSPPYISTLSRDITNEEIFYVGGKTDGGNIGVTIYLQNLTSGETRSLEVTSDDKGNWFYRHDAFLHAGNYLLWAQASLGEEVSPPSPQIQLTVRQTALQFGASRVSWETLYLILAAFLFLLNAGLAVFIVVHFKSAKRKSAQWLKEVHEAEQSVRRGFAVLRRDIERELEMVHEAKINKKLSSEELKREEQLLKDLAWAEQYIGKEIWDIEETNQGHKE